MILQEGHIFLIIHVKSHSWIVLRLKDMKTCLVMVTIITSFNSAIQATVMYKIASYIQMAWSFQMKFEIDTFEVKILQIR